MSIILNAINYFWKLGFNEEALDLYVKRYSDSQCICLDVANEVMDYGGRIEVTNDELRPFSQMNFIILEAVDRTLRKGYRPEDIILGQSSAYHVGIINDQEDMFVALRCYEWEEEYDVELAKMIEDGSVLENLFESEPRIDYYCAYTSRLKAGTIECRYMVFPRSFSNSNPEQYSSGLFEEDNFAYQPNFTTFRIHPSETRKEVKIEGYFHIDNGILMTYTGKSEHVIIPEGTKKLRNSVFWNCLSMKKVTIPKTVFSLGGDTFYNCENLTELTIPSSVVIMGDNPFANCPKLDLLNNSPHFVFEDGALYNNDMTRLIYCAIKREGDVFVVPDGVISVSKHSFYNCRNLRKIVIPESVKIMENNPFSNLQNMKLKNNSPHFIFKNGALYNKIMTTLFYYEHSYESTKLIIPEGVKIIGRHSFYNCQSIEKIEIPRSVDIIGYNPFTNCSRLSLENHSPHFTYENNTLYSTGKSVLIYHSIPDPSDTFIIPETVWKIGRSAFFNCTNLKSVVIPKSITIIDRSAFGNCKNLEQIIIPNSVNTIGEWAFMNCSNLKEISIPKNASIEAHTFMNCPATIIRR